MILIALLHSPPFHATAYKDFIIFYYYYRKMFRCVFKLPLWEHLSELLGTFNTEPRSVPLNNKYTDFVKVKLIAG